MIRAQVGYTSAPIKVIMKADSECYGLRWVTLRGDNGQS